MMCRWLLRTVVVLFSLAGVTKGWAKEVRDTLFSPSGDRVIVVTTKIGFQDIRDILEETR